MKRVVPIDHLKKKKILGSNQDGSREFISVLAAICANGTSLPPALIYQGDFYDLQDTWLEDYDHSSDEAYFAVSKKGWTNENLGLSWLSKTFESKTADKAGNGKRLLIVDGHSNHVNMRFMDFEFAERGRAPQRRSAVVARLQTLSRQLSLRSAGGRRSGGV